jgi:hypothetical protein
MRRRTTANMGYTTMRGSVLRMKVLCKVEHSCFVLKFSGNNPALRVAQNRWVQAYRTTVQKLTTLKKNKQGQIKYLCDKTT